MTTKAVFSQKHPFDRTVYSYNFQGVLQPGDVVTSSTGVISNPLDTSLVMTVANTVANTVNVIISGGQNKTEYDISFRVRTAFQDNFERSAILPVSDDIEPKGQVQPPIFASIGVGAGLTSTLVNGELIISLADTAVVPGNYNSLADITVNEYGEITGAQNLDGIDGGSF